MNTFLSVLLLHSLFAMPALSCNQSCFCKKYKTLKLRSTFRGQYKNVLQEQKGALISNKNQIGFAGNQFNRSPLRSELYDVNTGKGYTTSIIGKFVIIDLPQIYEINTIKFWVYDRDVTLRTFDLKVYVQNSQSLVQLVYEDTVATSIKKIKFSDTFVKQILIYDNNGSSVNQYLHILNLQAYFEF
ncbi:unnamed protein product (macronuclear) [Paramecium tetraurelia]|uniref:Malectin domain-containing protein n=1 Tax=Paramecium tetraurelia TaxID=5888 RepID=A0CRV9_PARTE|nr:uncharacterized protein GSPATT00009841001 [Paramecium tetraurelia]CAK73526.1 unnamed protein product [Paramecium tetraurelia]|eukprot:XP_001440923.1 hypothetical protein (macronuclear) [Paramecium tetraurelia strain d4-2]